MTAAVMTSAYDYLPLLKQGQWFSQLSHELQHQLLERASLHKLAANECIFARGDTFNGLFVVVNGLVRVVGYGHSESGKESLLALLDAPEWFGEISFFDRQPRPYDAWTVNPTTVIQLTPQVLDSILATNPDYWRQFSLLLIHKLRLTYAAIEHALVSPTISRLAYRLLMMANSPSTPQPTSAITRRILPISQDQLAHFLAVSRQTTNQLLKNLEQQGLIKLHRNNIEVLDMKALEALAESGAN
ncbi:Crp/Fnr family transcriptional regulator [Agitococcus lubricus]|uniref:CRP-like cAMP-binding protein n=1 Tax=Agitococcus lubricus TaxID=1077255 RepID=A0A2T5J2V6_9GAMM|nr:Crp/Fnr family transcriptional regulator [Agitococcus lubricus]PTQ90944.1 CRP-like cAMP-binding protein [Agitococcus lubricus]